MTHGLPTATPTHRTDFEGAPTMADRTTANTTLENAIRRASAPARDARRTNAARAHQGRGIRHSQIRGGRPIGLRRTQGR